MSKEIKRYMEECDACQRSRFCWQSPVSPFHIHNVLNRPWVMTSINMIKPLSESQGKDPILIIMDYFSKQLHMIPTSAKLTAEETAKLHRENVIYMAYPRK